MVPASAPLPRLSPRTIASRIFPATALALAVNLTLFALLRAAGVSFTGDFGQGPEPASLPVWFLVRSTALPALGAGLVLLGLRALTTRPERAFVASSALVLLASLPGPFLVPGADETTRAAMLLLHASTAAAIVTALLGRHDLLAVARGTDVLPAT